MLTQDEAIEHLRADPAYADLVRDAYFDRDVTAAARRFAGSEEFAEVLRLIGDVTGKVVLDLGAGCGIAAYAFAQRGARQVYALEPSDSDSVGRSAIARLTAGMSVMPIDAFGESIPLLDASVDVVYTRQVLHHTQDLPQVLRECARVLTPDGVFIACREHVVDDAEQLAAFLTAHPIHQLAGGENAYRLDEYIAAIHGAGLRGLRALAPFDSVINGFPTYTKAQIDGLTRDKLAPIVGQAVASALVRLPGVDALIRGAIQRKYRHPGRLYSFYARRG